MTVTKGNYKRPNESQDNKGKREVGLMQIECTLRNRTAAELQTYKT